jgi:integrase
MSSVQPLMDAAGRRRSPATMPGFRAGKAPRNKGQRYPADPPTVEEIIAVMRQAQRAHYGHRLTGLIVVLWRAGLGINEALSLTETDLDERRGSILVRHGKNDRRREVGMDPWGWPELQPWLAERAKLPVGPLFCVIVGPTRGMRGRPPPPGLSCTARRSRPGCAGAWPRTSSGIPTRWSCCTRGSRCR